VKVSSSEYVLKCCSCGRSRAVRTVIQVVTALPLVGKSPYSSFFTIVGTGSGVPESTPAGFCVFLLEPESKICEKPDPDSLFNVGSSSSLCGHFLSKNMGKLRLDR